MRALDVTESDHSLDDKLFKLISQKKHNTDIINKRTSKKRLLPLISAVESGRPDIVKKVLEMGADPNMKGLTDMQSPLYRCISLIFMAKNPEEYRKYFLSTPITPEILDAIRRHSAGMHGFTLEQQKIHINDKSLQEMSNEVINEFIKHCTEHPKKTCFYPNSNKKIDCWEIAHQFKAKNVMQVLDDIKQ